MVPSKAPSFELDDCRIENWRVRFLALPISAEMVSTAATSADEDCCCDGSIAGNACVANVTVKVALLLPPGIEYDLNGGA